VEELVGRRLPDWLRERLLVENGFDVDDSIGVTGRRWSFLPVMDRSNRKRMTRTCNDIARCNDRSTAGTLCVPEGAVMVGSALASSPDLWLLPDPAYPSVLGLDLYRRGPGGSLVSMEVKLTDLAPTEEQVAALVEPAEPLPTFRYNVDPQACRRSPNLCQVCGRRRGWQCSEAWSPVCPWCVAEGRVGENKNIIFSEWLEQPGSMPVDHGIDSAIIAEVLTRTPYVSTFQELLWPTCCADACAFVGRLTGAQILDLPASVLAENHLELFVDSSCPEFDPEDPAVLGFLCLHCGEPGVVLDMS